MTDYGKVLSSFWTDPAVRRLEPEQKLLLLYYFSSPHSNMAGLYYCPHVYAAEETGVPRELVAEWTLGPLARFLTFDAETAEVLVHRLARHRIGRELKPGDRRRAHVVELLSAAHSSRLRSRFLELYADWGLSGVPTPLAPSLPLPRGHDAPPKGHHARAEAEAATETGAEAEAEGHPPPPRSADYVVRCVMALNRGLAANPAVAARREIVASTQVGRVTWAEDGIPLELAERVVEERARSYRPSEHNRQPSGLRYFDAAVREEHERERQRLEVGAEITPRWLAELRDESPGVRHA